MRSASARRAALRRPRDLRSAPAPARARPRRPIRRAAAPAAARAAASGRPDTPPRRAAAASAPRMRRENQVPRADWRKRCEDAGFYYHSVGGTYWDETACYAFTSEQVDRLEEVTAELHKMCLEAAEEVVRARRFAEFAIPAQYQELIAESWQRGEPSLYGRFDFSWDGEGEPKLLEYNADTPTALLEASVVQWHWLEDTHSDADQFNSLHEKLVERWKAIRSALGATRLHVCALKDNDEDLGTAEYLRDCALQAGWDARALNIEDIGWNGEQFVDLDDQPIEALFKLYPWEWRIRRE